MGKKKEFKLMEISVYRMDNKQYVGGHHKAKVDRAEVIAACEKARTDSLNNPNFLYTVGIVYYNGKQAIGFGGKGMDTIGKGWAFLHGKLLADVFKATFWHEYDEAEDQTIKFE